jgi:pimeloyl-ACP methyl ester carboxylesterase
VLTTKHLEAGSSAQASCRYIDVAGGTIYAELIGQGAPLVMIHGWPLDHRLFARQVGPLAESLLVITYDRRGFGRSTAPPGLSLELDDIDRLLDALDLESAHILGMSQGGRIALRYAATRPERVRSLILQGAVVDGLEFNEQPEEQIPVAEFAELAKAGQLEQVISRWRSHPMMHLPSSDTDASALIDDILSDYTGIDLVSFDPDSYGFSTDVLERMSTFERPVMVVTGARETATRQAHAAELLRHLPDCKEVVLPKSGHLANLTEPVEYNLAIIDFIGGAETLASSP